MSKPYTIDDLPFDEWLAELANGYGVEEIELNAIDSLSASVELSFGVFDTIGSA